MKVQIINVKLPFIEAIEHLRNDKDAIACVCINDSRPCIILRTENNELNIVEENLFTKTEKTINELSKRLLSLDNILEHKWQMIYKLLSE